LLNDLRKGLVPNQANTILQALCRELPPGPEPTRLFAKNDKVDGFNSSRLAGLPGSVHKYGAKDFIAASNEEEQKAARRALNQLRVMANLSIKVGARVMLIKNVDETLVNGSTGTVIGMMTPTEQAPDGIDPMVHIGKTWTNGVKYPIVHFNTMEGMRTALVYEDEFRIETRDNHLLASRIQVTCSAND
ncbi:uncharacterized protein SCHCODRAFT_02497413, partial [Schizophyllum commune H4-8]|uniref:uncharacterized protein n=1 Tax=Schizophyllum commune (strain H4-8 / FGSC 9210) TaxID=578458 RepID=UPI00215F8B3F